MEGVGIDVGVCLFLVSTPTLIRSHPHPISDKKIIVEK
jgi:hypothetical protein